MKREIIFDIPDNPEYRVVCRFGYHWFINFAWWAHVQKKRYYKKWLLFGKKKHRWVEIDKGWFGFSYDTNEGLNAAALSFFDKTVLSDHKLISEKIW